MLWSDAPVLHLTSPAPAAWDNVFAPIAQKLDVPLVPAAEWLEKLRMSARGHANDNDDSAHTLFQFLEGVLMNRETPLATEQAVVISPSLAQLEPIGDADALRWMASAAATSSSISLRGRGSGRMRNVTYSGWKAMV